MIDYDEGVRYVFIDGAYMEAMARDRGTALFGEPAELDYRKIAADVKGKRYFYYDCLPAKTNSQTEEDFAVRLAAKERQFENLREQPGWHINQGLAKWKQKRGITQKEVDISIAVDMLTHAHRKNMNTAVLLAGDLDFRPLIEALVRDGMYVVLHYDETSISPDLKYAADRTVGIGDRKFWDYCTDAYRGRNPYPQIYDCSGLPPGKRLEIGALCDGLRAFVIVPEYPCEQTAYSIIFEKAPEMFEVIAGDDLARLKQFFSGVRGKVTWRVAHGPYRES